MNPIACALLLAAINMMAVNMAEKGDEHLQAQRQETSDALCGARSLKFLLQYLDYQDPPTLESLIGELYSGDAFLPCSLNDLNLALRRRGLDWSMIEVDSSAISSIPAPAIIHVSSSVGPGHFQVYLGCDGEFSRLWDGSSGAYVEATTSLTERFSGFALVAQRESPRSALV